MNILITPALILLCAANAPAAVKNVNAPAFKKLIEKNDGMILDTRTKGEFARGHIAGSELVDLQDPRVVDKLLTLPKNKPLYLYCYSGYRSKMVAAFLEKHGYTRLYNLERGILDWTGKKYALQKSNNAPAPPMADALSTDEYQKLVADEKMVFFDFYAQWCVPCQQMMPMIDALKKEYAGKVKIVKVNAEASMELCQKLGIQSVPCLLLYKNGKKTWSKNGVTTKDELVELFSGGH